MIGDDRPRGRGLAAGVCEWLDMPSELIDRLKQVTGTADPFLSKRKEHRQNLRTKTQLDLCCGGETLLVSVLDVSDSGIGFLCRKRLTVGEEIGLRMAYEQDRAFEPFVVRRETGTVGGYKIGVVTPE